MKVILFIIIFTIGLMGQFPNFPNFVSEESVSDTSPPDYFDTSPVIVYTAPNVDTIKVLPSEIDSSDVRYFRITYQTMQKSTSSGTINLEWADILTGDSTYALAHAITFNDITDLADQQAYAFEDTVEIIEYIFSTVDSSGNQSTTQTIYDTMTVNGGVTVPVDSVWFKNRAVTGANGDSSFVRLNPFGYDDNLAWADSTKIKMAVNVYCNFFTYSALTTWWGGTHYLFDYAVSDTLSKFYADSVRTDFQSYSNEYAFNDNDSLFYTTLQFVEFSFNGKMVRYYFQRSSVDTIYRQQYPELTDFTPDGLTDSVRFQIYATENTGDSVGVWDVADITQTAILDWVLADTIDTTIVYDVSEDSIVTFYCYVKDTIPNIDSLYDDVEINDNDDTTPPSLAGGDITVTIDSLYNLKIDTTTTFYSSDADFWYMLLQFKDEDHAGWYNIATVYNDTLSPATYDFPYSFAEDTVFFRIAFYDSTSNNSVVTNDTTTTTWFDIVAEIDTSRSAVDNFRVFRNTSQSLTGADSSHNLIVIGDCDTTNVEADTVEIPIADINIGTGNYYSYRIQIDGSWQDTVSNWKWYPAPDSINSYAWGQSASADSDSVKLTASGYDTKIDSVTFFKNSSAYSTASGDRWFSVNDSLLDTTLLVSENAGTTLYISALCYYNDANSGQIGAEGANQDTVLIPTEGGGANDWTFYYTGDQGDSSVAYVKGTTDSTRSGTVGGSGSVEEVGNTGFAFRHTANNGGIYWDVNFTTEILDDSVGTIYFDVYINTVPSSDAAFFECYVDNANNIVGTVRTDSTMRFGYEGELGGATQELHTGTDQINSGEWVRIGVAWSVENDVLATKVASNAWEESSGLTMNAWDVEVDRFDLGEGSAGGSFTTDIRVDNVKIYGTYQYSE